MELEEKLKLAFTQGMCYQNMFTEKHGYNEKYSFDNWLAENEQLKACNIISWVDCKKEIPQNRRVLARLVLKNIKTTIIAGYSEENGWMSKGEKFTQNQITHWAELPE